MLTRLSRGRIISYVALILMGLGATLFVVWPRKTPDRNPSPAVAFRETQRQVMELRQQLATLEKNALRKNPQLEERRKALTAAVVSTMQRQGHDPQTYQQRLQALEDKMNQQGLDQKQRDQIMNEARQQIQELQQAEEQALSEPKIASDRRSLEQDLLVAMRKEDPKVDELIQRLQKAEGELQRMLIPAPPG